MALRNTPTSKRQYFRLVPTRTMLPGFTHCPDPRQTELVAFICQPAHVSRTTLFDSRVRMPVPINGDKIQL